MIPLTFQPKTLTGRSEKSFHESHDVKPDTASKSVPEAWDEGAGSPWGRGGGAMRAQWSSPLEPRLPGAAQKGREAAKGSEETRRDTDQTECWGGVGPGTPQQRPPRFRPEQRVGAHSLGPGSVLQQPQHLPAQGSGGSASLAAGSPVGTACGRHTALVIGTAFSQPTHFRV